MDSIPGEILVNHLSTFDILKLSRTSKHVSSICQNSQTWRYLLQKDYNLRFDKSNPLRKYTKLVLIDISKTLTSVGYYYRQIYEKIGYYNELEIKQDETKYGVHLGTSELVAWHSSRYYELALGVLNFALKSDGNSIHQNNVSSEIVDLLKSYSPYPNTLLTLLIYKADIEKYQRDIINYYNDLAQRS